MYCQSRSTENIQKCNETHTRYIYKYQKNPSVRISLFRNKFKIRKYILTGTQKDVNYQQCTKCFFKIRLYMQPSRRTLYPYLMGACMFLFRLRVAFLMYELAGIRDNFDNDMHIKNGMSEITFQLRWTLFLLVTNNFYCYFMNNKTRHLLLYQG